MRANLPLSLRYEEYASQLGFKFPSRQDQMSIDASAATDQGNVSYEVPAMQAVYKIDVPAGGENHTPGFAEVRTAQAKLLTARLRKVSKRITRQS